MYCVASGKQEKVQACLVTLWLFIISCHSLSKTTLGSLCSWKPAWSLKKRPHSMCLKPFVKMCIFVVIQIFWSLRKYREQQAEAWWRASIWRSHRKVVIKQCSYHNNISDIQNRLSYSKVVYPAIIVLFSCLMEVNHGVRTGPDYPFR